MKLFVAKLPPSVTSERLQTMFEAFGEVISAKVIIDHDTGSSKGYGFVEMGSSDAGQAAIQGLNDAQLEGNTLVVKESDPPGSRPSRSGPPRSGGFNRGGGDRPRFDRNNDRGGDRPRFDRNNDRGGDRYNQDRDRSRNRYEDDDDAPRRRRF